MRILVTGASGGMAAPIIEALLNRKVDVIVTSRSSQKIEESDFYNQVRFIPYDLSERKESDLYSYFEKPDKVIHLAWDKLKDHKNEAHTGQILEDHKNFLLNMISNGLKDITCVGTCYEYGLLEGELAETLPSEPVIAYGSGKNSLRVYLEELQKDFDFNLKWLRVFNVFSEGKSGGNLYSHLMNAVTAKQEYFNMSGGEQVRDYLTAPEVTERIVSVAMQQQITGIINCCSGKPVKLKDMILNFLQTKNLHIKLNLGFYPYLSHEPMVHWGSVAKLNLALEASKAEK